MSLTESNHEELTKTMEDTGTDYSKSLSQVKGARYLRECCMKLNASTLTFCTATTYFHKFYSVMKLEDYDPYLIACTCIYLAAKVKNDDVKIRDVINCGYHSIHKNDSPLSLDPYFELRDALVEAELFIMRSLKFDLEVDLPLKYLFYFFESLKDWLGENVFIEKPVVSVAISILLDCYHLPFILKYSPPVLAVGAIFLAFNAYGIEVPGYDEKNVKPWFSCLHPDCGQSVVSELAEVITDMYKQEESLLNPS